jgi:hypothetical protein
LFCGLVFRVGRVAADGFQPVSSEELKMTSEPLAPGAPAIILYRQVDRKDLGRANTEYNYVRIKILTEEGRKYANIEIPYLRQQATISNIRARTIHPDGTIVNFDGKSYDQMISKSKTLKVLAKTFTMPDVQVDILEAKEPRKYALELPGPSRDTDTFEITLPEGYAVDDLPAPVNADYSFASYHSKAEIQGSVLKYTRTFEVKEVSIPLQKIDELKKLYRTIAGDERSTAVLKPAGPATAKSN